MGEGGGGGCQKPNVLEGSMKLNWNFHRGGIGGPNCGRDIDIHVPLSGQLDS